MTVRVRFAPSPTGRLHIGNLRTALLAWLFARQQRGVFIVRIDDTDRERSRPEYEREILDDLRWAGLDWDEGVERGGPETSYRQSERAAIYEEAVSRLLAMDAAYPCYCTHEELEAHRLDRQARHLPPAYSGRCAALTPAQRTAMEADGRAASIRFRLPSREVVFDDIIRGSIRQHTDDLGGDFIIRRPDGAALYNLASVVDDGRMGITHILRGEEFITTTARQILMFEALGHPVPRFAHTTLILGHDRQKLSKRDGATEIRAYREMGYLPEGIINYLSLLGWSPLDGNEMLTRERLLAEFSLERVGAAPAIFDATKLRHINAMHLRALPLEELEKRAAPFVDSGHRFVLEWEPARRRAALEMARTGMETLADINRELAPLAGGAFDLEPEARGEFLSLDGQPVATALAGALDQASAFDGNAFKMLSEAVKSATGRKGKPLMMPMRIALTGRLHGPELKALVPLLGLEECRARLAAFNKLMETVG